MNIAFAVISLLFEPLLIKLNLIAGIDWHGAAHCLKNRLLGPSHLRKCPVSMGLIANFGTFVPAEWPTGLTTYMKPSLSSDQSCDSTSSQAITWPTPFLYLQRMRRASKASCVMGLCPVTARADFFPQLLNGDHSRNGHPHCQLQTCDAGRSDSYLEVTTSRYC